jgi:Mor family transcriptional regulator
MKKDNNQNLKDLKKLEKFIGSENYSKVAQYFAGRALYFPRTIFIAKKHQDIRKEFEDGASYRELARRYGFTEQHIRNITKERENERQENGGLFPYINRFFNKLLGRKKQD